jgi:Sulfotransferase family/Aspartyl/Asparaginyl beta-hydroxylase
MKLEKPFYRLSVRFDVQRLRTEIEALRASAWANHPNDIKGNRSLRLISVEGGENDEVDGVMLPTLHLSGSPYLCQVLASFGVVWSRSRLLKLEPFTGVPQHADINYHWFNRVRLHIPIVTHPDVRFFCGNDSVHMAAGEAWIFDNWRLHRVENPVDADRIHLVADTSGSSSFWQFVALSETPSVAAHEHRYDATRTPRLLTEQTALRAVMPPAEVDLLLLDLQAELIAKPDAASQEQLMRYCALLHSFRRDWRQLYQLFGESEAGWPEYTKLRDSFRFAAKELGETLTMRTNRVTSHQVLEGRVLRAVLPLKGSSGLPRNPQRKITLQRPIFIVSAPRSGSTLLFETLATSDQICTVGGEAHWLIESIPELRPGAPGVESNRLGALNYSDDVSARIVEQILAHLQDSRGRPLSPSPPWRLLEKTPKNALRVPFFDRIFPDALFIFLWRDPHENLSSIIEAWRSGNWKTYNGLDGFDGPWSLLLPPGWTQFRGRSLEEIAAFQWETTNRILLDDLGALPHNRWSAVNYSELISDPAATIRRLCDFAGIAFQGALAERVAGPLPLSRFTQTPPAPGKWLQNEAAVLRVMPSIQATWQRLQELTSAYAPKR